MRFYRLARVNGQDGCTGYEFFTNKRDAETAAREWMASREEEEYGEMIEAKITEVKVTPTRAGILNALNSLASHADNG